MPFVLQFTNIHTEHMKTARLFHNYLTSLVQVNIKGMLKAAPNYLFIIIKVQKYICLFVSSRILLLRFKDTIK